MPESLPLPMVESTYTEEELAEFVAGRMRFAARGQLDPSVPVPINPAAKGRWPLSWSQEPNEPLLHLVLVAPDWMQVASRAMGMGQQLARLLGTEIGFSLLRADPLQVRRFLPLAEATEAKKQALGQPARRPLIGTGDFVRRFMNGGFPITTVTQTNPEGGMTIAIGFGPRPGDEPSPGKFADNLYGTNGVPGRRPAIPPRFPGLTADIRAKIRRAVKQWGEGEAPSLSYEPPGPLFMARELTDATTLFTDQQQA